MKASKADAWEARACGAGPRFRFAHLEVVRELELLQAMEAIQVRHDLKLVVVKVEHLERRPAFEPLHPLRLGQKVLPQAQEAQACAAGSRSAVAGLCKAQEPTEATSSGRGRQQRKF